MSGTDPDWLLLTIKGYWDGQLIDSTLFYLADFRSDTPGQDYIVKDWQWVDLNNWSDDVDSLSFSISSSDTDSAGVMRTSDEFCLDDIRAAFPPSGGGVHEVYQNNLFKVYPNPVASGGKLYLENKQQTFSNEEYTISLYNLLGEKVMEVKGNFQKPLPLPQLSPGIYTIAIYTKQQLVYTQKLLLQ